MVTVGDLVAVDPVRLNRLSGVAEATRREVRPGRRQWRDKSGLAVTGRGQDRRTVLAPAMRRCPIRCAAKLLLAHSGTARAASRRATARLLLGLDPGLDPFASETN